jgi:2-oxo-hept-3-ene-1,7-dioate hydratase
LRGVLDASTIQALAARLDEAEKTRTQVRQFSLEHPGMTIEDAYAVQEAWVAAKLARGRRLVGHKIGLTSKAMQRFSNITEPDYGSLLDDMIYASGDKLPAARFIEPRAEVELAFVLKRDLKAPDCTLEDVLAATDYMVPAIEIIDARIQRVDPETKVTRKVFDTISDNAANAAVVLGETRFQPSDVDLCWVSAILKKNGEIEDTGVAAAVLGHPAKGPAWLANKLHPHGVTLRAGEVILGGSFTSPIAGAAGDAFEIDYGPLGSISFRFA